MKPYIISHMMTSLDGRIDCAMTELLDSSDSYYEALKKLDAPSQLMGRVTMQMHFADSMPFKAKNQQGIGKTAHHIASCAVGYTIAVDTRGTLRWSSNIQDDKPLLVITSETCPNEYLKYLEEKKISWIAVGQHEIELKGAMQILSDEFGVKRLAVTGGGHINGAFLKAGLIDEVSLMIAPGIDGRQGMCSVFDGIKEVNFHPTLLHLKSLKALDNGTVWLRYLVKR